MKLVVNQHTASAGAPESPLPRIRPGERPAWCDASPDHATWPRWRSAAAAGGLALDVWIALLLELRFVLEDQEAAGVVQPREVLRRAARADAETSRLAPMSLRAWHDRLSRHEPSGQDDLPEVVMPARLALRLAPGQALAPLLVGGDISLAIECDRAAARHGRTLESWALASALKRSADT